MKIVYFYLLVYTLLVGRVFSQETFHSRNIHFSHYIEGISNPEDLFHIHDQEWIIVCSMASSTHPGKIYAVHKENYQVLELFNGQLPAPHNAKKLQPFKPHGIYVKGNKSKGYYLYVINHSTREAIEKFELDFNSSTPQIKWLENIALPAPVWANGLVIDSREKIYVTSMYNPKDTDFLEKFQHKKVTGRIWQWDRTKKWRKLSKSQFSGANGIALSADEKNLYIAEWAGQKVHLLSTIDGRVSQSVNVDFLPDNIRWSAEGNLLIAGQRGLPKEVFLSRGISEENMYFSVMEIDSTLTVKKTLIRDGHRNFANATVAIQINNTYWLGCVENNKIAIYLKK